MNEVISNAGIFHNLINRIRQKGVKKKEIADYLNMPAPVFSSLSKTVIPLLMKINQDTKPELLEKEIDLAFEMVNNLSQTKTLSRLPDYIKKLEEFDNHNIELPDQFGYFSKLRKQAEHSFNFLKQYYNGRYHMYYLSSDRYCIKKDPFMIRCNNLEKVAECFKGNQNSSLRYNGIAVVNNGHTLTLQLAETDDKPEEYLMMHLSLPYNRKTAYLRGVFSCLNFARQPIARKVVLVFQDDQTQWSKFEEMTSVYYPDPDFLPHGEIVEYLLSNQSFIECKTVSNPDYSFRDLLKEADNGQSRFEKQDINQ